MLLSIDDQCSSAIVDEYKAMSSTLIFFINFAFHVSHVPFKFDSLLVVEDLDFFIRIVEDSLKLLFHDIKVCFYITPHSTRCEIPTSNSYQGKAIANHSLENEIFLTLLSDCSVLLYFSVYLCVQHNTSILGEL